jgi:hypothetical protein
MSESENFGATSNPEFIFESNPEPKQGNRLGAEQHQISNIKNRCKYKYVYHNDIHINIFGYFKSLINCLYALLHFAPCFLDLYLHSSQDR